MITFDFNYESSSGCSRIHKMHTIPLLKNESNFIEIFFFFLAGALLFSQQPENRQEAAILLVFMLFDEVASIHTGIDDENCAESKPAAFSLPAFITKRLVHLFLCVVLFSTLGQNTGFIASR